MSEEPFDTSLLEAALERQRQALEQERQQIVDRAQPLLDEWGPVYRIRQAYLFGSVARPGRFRRTSDVDLAVEQSNARSLFSAWGRFCGDLGRLVELVHCPFADKVRREGIPWTRST